MIQQPEHETLPFMSERAADDLDTCFLHAFTEIFTAGEIATWIAVFDHYDGIVTTLRDFRFPDQEE